VARLAERPLVALSVALVAGAVLLLAPSGTRTPPPRPPVTAAVAWPHAQGAAVSATSADGAPYQPLLFLDARTSVGTAPSRDGAFQMLVWRSAAGLVRPLRRLPSRDEPSFAELAADGRALAWVEDTHNGSDLSLWTVNLADGRAPRRVASIPGDALFDDSQYDLVIHDGRVSWAASDPDRTGAVDVRSVALTGGPIDSRREPGQWELSAWPWMVDGATDPRGTGMLRNVLTGAQVAVARPAQARNTRCSPTWCQMVDLAGDGSTDVELMHPDGSGRIRVAGRTTVPAIPEVAPLDRFEVLWTTDLNLDLTHNGQLLVYEIPTRRTVELSPDASTVTCRNGVLWWSNGNGSQAATLWHTLDLRTITP
jgi:hypothetical protein